MSKVYKSFSPQPDMNDQALAKALKNGDIERVDVTREEVWERMPKHLATFGEELHNSRFGLMTSLAMKRKEQLLKTAEITGYFKCYEETLNGIPVNYQKLRERLTSK